VRGDGGRVGSLKEHRRRGRALDAEIDALHRKITLEQLAMDAKAFPRESLEGCETGLVLFCGAFLGVNDAIHFAQAGIQTVCVDTNADSLATMRTLYPEEWEFVQSDAWKYAEAARDLGLTWDAVSVDTWTGDASRRSMETLELWTAIANRLVAVTVGERDTWQTPRGWHSWTQQRSEKADWLVLERA